MLPPPELPRPLPPAVLRLARAVPGAAATLDTLLDDPLERALAGLGPPPAESADLGRAVLAAQALADGGKALPAAVAADLERRAVGDPRWWVPAARLHVLASPDRERAARAALSGQDLPYVFPGELHALQVELLAAADRVLPALHVDQARRLASFSADALELDIACVGMWFWPHLRVLDEGRIRRELRHLRASRHLLPGAVGLAAAYRLRVGDDASADLTKVAAFERWLVSLAAALDRPVR